MDRNAGEADLEGLKQVIWLGRLDRKNAFTHITSGMDYILGARSCEGMCYIHNKTT